MLAPPTSPTTPPSADSPESAPVIAARRVPLALHQLPDDALRNITGVFTDVDGTLTTRGKLPAQAYSALERLHRAGIKVVPVTGRSIAWCEVITRLWPVDAVIGENGAFAMRIDSRGHLTTDFVDDAQTRARNLERIREIGAEVMRAVPGSALATDQVRAHGPVAFTPARLPSFISARTLAAEAVERGCHRFYVRTTVPHERSPVNAGGP